MFYNVIGERNPLIKVYDDSSSLICSIKTIGDPHLGRVFRTGVPKNRLGEREEQVYSEFESLLDPLGVDFIVIMGDLFDKTIISNECLNRTINIIEEACNTNIHTKYYILSGNHDFTKDKNKVSSFDLLIKYFSNHSLSNLIIVDHLITPLFIKEECLLYFSHYNPFSSLDKELEESSFILNEDNRYNKAKLKIAFGHWDITDFSAISGTEKFIDRSIPQEIRNNFDVVFTGHEHKPKKESLKDLEVYVTGSMQPYAFGEQLKDETNLYFSNSVEVIDNLLDKDIDTFLNTNVRILYKQDQALTRSFQCLSRTYKCIEESPTIIPLSKESDFTLEAEPLSFSKSFFKVLSSNEEESLKDVVKEIEQAFLNKNYPKD